jgi:hypothetical protein
VANLDIVYAEIALIQKVAEEAQSLNYESGADVGEQAERLENIAELASRNAPLLREIDKTLGG